MNTTKFNLAIVAQLLIIAPIIHVIDNGNLGNIVIVYSFVQVIGIVIIGHLIARK